MQYVYEYNFRNKDEILASEYQAGFSSEASSLVILKKITKKEILDNESSEILTGFKEVVRKQADKGITMKIQFHIFDELSKELILL